jgi:hypothetical protein
MKPKKILREATRVALASFGQMVVQEGAVWAARRLERRERAGGDATGRHAKRSARKGKRRKFADSPLEPLVAAGARFVEEKVNGLLESLASGGGRRTGGRKTRTARTAHDDGRDERADREDDREARAREDDPGEERDDDRGEGGRRKGRKGRKHGRRGGRDRG